MDEWTDDEQLLQKILEITDHLLKNPLDTAAWKEVSNLTEDPDGGCLLGFNRVEEASGTVHCEGCPFDFPDSQCGIVSLGFGDAGYIEISTARRLQIVVELAGFIKSHL